MVEDESGLRVPLLERGSRLPAHVAEYIARTRRLDDRHIGAVHQPLERGRRLGVTGVGEDLAADMEPVAVAAGGTVVQLYGLVPITYNLPLRPRGDVAGLEAGQHDRLPVDAPAHLEQRLEALLHPIGADEGQRSGLVNEDPVQHERRQAECVIAVEVGEEHDIDARRLHAHPMHVRQEWCARVEQHPSVDNDCAVISLGGEGGPRAKKGKFQATVTAGLRYTSWIACRSSIPSFIGRWNDLRPLIRPMPPARLLITAVRTASLRSPAPCDSPPELISPERPM